MKAMILCGGFGSRLRGVIGETQKAVAEVDGRPFLYIVVERLRTAGFDELIFCTHYQSDQVERALDELGGDVARRLWFCVSRNRWELEVPFLTPS
jgi:NDP-sugar pyrophosphorylase family protein